MTRRIPWIARAVLARCDVEAIAAARRSNYELLDRGLEFGQTLRKVFPSLPQDACPWAYPVIVDERPKMDYQLRARGVPLFTFGETLHPELLRNGDERTQNLANFLANRLMMLPAHQKLESSDVRHMCQTVNAFFREISGKRS